MDKRIIYTNDNGGVAVIIPTPEWLAKGLSIEDLALTTIPQGVAYEIINASDQPDRTFRNAWVKNGKAVDVDVVKAKDIAHEVRRGKRAEEFKPLDVEATIPSKAVQAEAKRQVVRDKYDLLQANIDGTDDVAVLTTIVKTLKGEV